jgi:hypothetical protein
VGRANGLFTTKSDEIVLVVIGESEDLMRYDVANINDQIPRLAHKTRIQIDRYFPISETFGAGSDMFRWNRTHALDSANPVVRVYAVVGNSAEHPSIVCRCVRHVLTQGGYHVNITIIHQRLVQGFRYFSGTAVRAGQIGRQEQDLT